jgi:hypothetical protein
VKKLVRKNPMAESKYKCSYTFAVTEVRTAGQKMGSLEEV